MTDGFQGAYSHPSIAITRVVSAWFLASAIWLFGFNRTVRYLLKPEGNTDTLITILRWASNHGQTVGLWVMCLGTVVGLTHVFAVYDHWLTENINRGLFVPRSGVWAMTVLMVIYLTYGMTLSSAAEFYNSQGRTAIEHLIAVVSFPIIPYFWIVYKDKFSTSTASTLLLRAAVTYPVVIAILGIAIRLNWTVLPERVATTYIIGGLSSAVLMLIAVIDVRSENRLSTTVSYSPPSKVRRITTTCYHKIRKSRASVLLTGFICSTGYDIFSLGWFAIQDVDYLTDFFRALIIGGLFASIGYLLAGAIIFSLPRGYRIATKHLRERT